MVCNHYYFKDKFDYQPYVCNKFHDFSMTVMDLSDFFVLRIKGAEYRIYISGIDKKEAMIVLKSSNLPILSAQKQAGNNSQKLSNEIRQIIYSLYRSKNLSKTIYNHLINSI